MTRAGWLVVGLAIGGLAMLALRSAPERADDDVAPLPAEPIPTARIEPESPATTATLAPMLVPGCPDMDADPIGPSLAESANLLMAELRDRVRGVGPERSEPLRLGLRALGRGETERGLRLMRDAPDRSEDGFDLASAAAFAQVVRALGEERDPSDALARLDDIEGRGPLAPIARALVARQAGDGTAELAALTEAHARSEDPAVAFALASLATRRGQSPQGLRALIDYQAQYPDDPWATQMLPVLQRRAALEAPMAVLAAEGVELHHTLGEAEAAELHDWVVGSLEAAASLLGVPRRPSLTVIVYADRDDFRSATCGPQWSGGIYDGSLRLSAETRRSELRVAVRHESLHAQLAHVAPRAPLWLHEGLAQVFQERVPADLERTLDLMARERTYVPFPSLEGSFVVIDDADSARFAYHQSYAMVAAILEREGNAALHRAVAHLRDDGDPRTLLNAMTTRPFDGDDLLTWIATR